MLTKVIPATLERHKKNKTKKTCLQILTELKKKVGGHISIFLTPKSLGVFFF